MSESLNKVVLITGGNLANRELYLSQAAFYIGKNIGSITRFSKIYDTAPWGFNHEQTFLNQALIVETCLLPHEVLEKINEIEKKMGRTRKDSKGYSARTIDIDILFFNDEIIDELDLIIPHPHIGKRMFVLKPLCEIMPDYFHPITKVSIKNMVESCEDKLAVFEYTK